jgi:hypothetical protein
MDGQRRDGAKGNFKNATKRQRGGMFRKRSTQKERDKSERKVASLTYWQRFDETFSNTAGHTDVAYKDWHAFLLGKGRPGPNYMQM